MPKFSDVRVTKEQRVEEIKYNYGFDELLGVRLYNLKRLVSQ